MSTTRPRPSRRPPRRNRLGLRRRREVLSENGSVGGGPRRRLHPAGQAIVVGIGALALAALLNAPGLRKTAESQNPGWKRDVGLWFAKPLTTVSHDTGLDLPRRGVKAAIGRSSDDDIVAAIVLPPAQPPPPAVTPPPPPATHPGIPGKPKPPQAEPPPPPSRPPPPPAKPAFSPQHPLRVYVGGDSLVIVPGNSLLRAMGASKAYKPVGPVDGHVATGLERPEVYNWFERIKTVMKKDKPKVVVVAFGANDNHNYMTGLPPGYDLGAFGSASWVKEYRRRVAGIMDTVIRAHGFVIYLGMPIARSESETRDFEVINRIISQEAKKRPQGALYLDTYLLFADPKTGGYAEYLPNSTGDLIKVRAGDGVHFETAGGDIIARQVLKALAARYDLTSWRKKRD